MTDSKKFNFTKAKFDGIVLPSKGRSYYYDTNVNYLALRVSTGGSLTFCYRRKIQNKLHEITIGQYPTISIATAREIAQKYNNDVAMGVFNPSKSQDVMTFLDAIRLVSKSWRINTIKSLETYIRKTPAELLNKDIKKIEFYEISKIFNSIEKPFAQAGWLKLMVKPAFNKAWEIGYLEHKFDALDRLKTARYIPRERYITRNEIPKLFETLKQFETHYRIYFLFIFFTGVRKENARLIHLDEINFDEKKWVIPASKAKTTREIIIMLSKEALEIIEFLKDNAVNGYLFPNVTRSTAYNRWQTLCKICDFENLHIHDIRHTVATYMNSNNVSINIIGKVLNHANIKTTAIYTHYEDDPVRQAQQSANLTMLKIANAEQNVLDFEEFKKKKSS